MKSTDLRIELKKEANLINKTYNDLVSSMETANTFRKRSLAARGLISGGAEKSWDSKHNENQRDMVLLERFIKAPDDYSDSLSQKELETEIINLHKISIDLNDIKKYYDESLIENKEHGIELKNAAIKKLETFKSPSSQIY